MIRALLSVGLLAGLAGLVLLLPSRPAGSTGAVLADGRHTKLTPAGCCPVARWLPDGRAVSFYHRPADGPAGLWSVDESGALTYRWPRFGHLSADGRTLAVPVGDVTLVERLDGSLGLTLANGGVETLPAPDGQAVAYLARERAGGRTHDALDQVVVAPLDGGPPRSLLRLARADYLVWFSDSRRLAVFGWRPDGTSPGLWVIDSVAGTAEQVVAANFLTAIAPSPDGQWIAYLATLQPVPGDNGVWLTRPDGSDRRRLPHERAFQWAADSTALLLLMPAPGGKEIHRLELATEARTTLVGREQVDFDVEADAWSVAPDGQSIVYRSSRDRALWRLSLAP
jgi:hypothetical protein